jgi:hypothetical protein
VPQHPVVVDEKKEQNWKQFLQLVNSSILRVKVPMLTILILAVGRMRVLVREIEYAVLLLARVEQVLADVV